MKKRRKPSGRRLPEEMMETARAALPGRKSDGETVRAAATGKQRKPSGRRFRRKRRDNRQGAAFTETVMKTARVADLAETTVRGFRKTGSERRRCPRRPTIPRSRPSRADNRQQTKNAHKKDNDTIRPRHDGRRTKKARTERFPSIRSSCRSQAG